MNYSSNFLAGVPFTAGTFAWSEALALYNHY